MIPQALFSHLCDVEYNYLSKRKKLRDDILPACERSKDPPVAGSW